MVLGSLRCGKISPDSCVFNYEIKLTERFYYNSLIFALKPLDVFLFFVQKTKTFVQILLEIKQEPFCFFSRKIPVSMGLFIRLFL